MLTNSLDKWIVSFVTACLLFLLWPQLPPAISLSPMVAAALLLWHWPLGRYISGFLLGTVWIASVGHWQLHWQLPAQQIAQPVLVKGQIDSLVSQGERVRFNFVISELEQRFLWIKPKVRISWYAPDPMPKQGQHWQFYLKLKPPHGLANQGGFHYQQWLFSQGVVATGYVREQAGANQLLQDSPTSRQQQVDTLDRHHFANQAWLAALSLGDRRGLQQDDWQLVQQTGIAHLIAISGLHLGIVASFSYAIMALLLSVGLARARHPVLLGLSAHQGALCITLLTTFVYAAMAGFALPTLRAWLMLLLVTLLSLRQQQWQGRHILLYSLLAFCLLFPLSFYSLSFWLSFTAILSIWFMVWRWSLPLAFSWRSVLMITLRSQLVLFVLMLPLVAWQFSLFAPLSPLVNVLAVPVVSFVLLPLCLAATLAQWLGLAFAGELFAIADQLIAYGLNWLQTLAAMWPGWPLQRWPISVWLCVTMAILLVFLPPISTKKWLKPVLLVLFCLPLLSYLRPVHQAGWRLDVLDVGQGLAVMISQQGRAMLYDVGPTFDSGFNMAEAVIIPLLRDKGIATLDKVFISHGDNDHSGSLPALLAKVPVTEVISDTQGCLQGKVWQWQGVNIKALWPPQAATESENDTSCVLLVEGQGVRLLLPGDISKKVEAELIATYGDGLRADILLAPHHGSNTSSSTAFIQAVAPTYVVFSQGYMNRWGFPKQTVVARYREQGVRTLQTSQAGQISFYIEIDKPIALTRFRQDHYPRWYANE